MQLLYPEFKTWTISFEDVNTFNKVIDTGLDTLFELGVVDIGHSEMVLVFDKFNDFEKFKNVLVKNKTNFDAGSN